MSSMKFGGTVPDVLTLLVGGRKEAYPLEALEKYARLITWVILPENECQIWTSGKIAVANYVRWTARGRAFGVPPDAPDLAQVMQEHFTSDVITKAFLWPRGPMDSDHVFFNEHDKVELAADMVHALLQMEQHSEVLQTKPSVNKAIRFLENDGFRSGSKVGASRKTIMDAWRTHTAQAPFQVADRLQDRMITYAVPNDRYFCEYFYSNRDDENAGLREWLGLSRYVQESVVSVLNDASLTSRKFVAFPDCIESIPFSFMPFDGEQEELVLAYQVNPDQPLKRPRRPARPLGKLGHKRLP